MRVALAFALIASFRAHANMATDIATQAVSAAACGELPSCQVNAALLTGELMPDVKKNTDAVKKLPDSVATAAQIVQQTQANNAPATNLTSQQVTAQTSEMASKAKAAATDAAKLVEKTAKAAAQALAGGALDTAYCTSTYPPSLDSTVPSNSSSRTSCVTQAGLMATALTGLAKKLNGQAQQNEEKAKGLEQEANGLGQASSTVGSYGNGMSTGSPSLSAIDPPSRGGAGLAEFGLKDPLGEQEAEISSNLNGSKSQGVNLGAATPFADDVENDPRASKAPDLLSDKGSQQRALASNNSASSDAGGVEYTGGASEEDARRKQMEGMPASSSSSFNGGLGIAGLPSMATSDEGSLNVNAPAEFGGFSSLNGLDMETTDTHYELTIWDRASLMHQYMDIRTRAPLAQGRGRALSLHQYLASKTAKPRDSLEEAKATARVPASPLDSRK